MNHQPVDTNLKIGSNERVEEKFLLVEELIDAWQTYGVSSSRMVTMLNDFVIKLGINGQFLVTPDYVQSVLWAENKNNQRTHLTIRTSGKYDLNKLTKIYQLIKKITCGEMGLVEGRHQLEKIEALPRLYGTAIISLAFFFCSASFAIITGAAWTESLLAGLLALVCLINSAIFNRKSGLFPLQEFISAIVIIVLARWLGSYITEIRPSLIAVASLAWFIPGFEITMASNELLLGNTINGIIWFTKASVVFAKLLGGYILGWTLSLLIVDPQINPILASIHVPEIWTFIAAAFLTASFAFILNVQLRHITGVVLGGMVIWATMQLGNQLGYWQGTFFSAAMMMVFTFLFTTRYSLPPTIMTVPTVLLLVPGLEAIRAIYIIYNSGFQAASHELFIVLILIGSVIGGVMVGDSICLLGLKKFSSYIKKI